MEKELIIKTEDKELRITSVELVEIINRFRDEESKIANKKVAELKHKSFIEKIRNELKVLESLGLGGEQNILPSSYINSQNKTQPCYSLNRDGMLQMLNSESAYCRAKTIQYIDKLEIENKQLKEQQNELSLLLLDIYNGGQAGIVASKKLSEIETAKAIKPLEEKIEQDRPLVELAKKRLDKNGLISITDATKTFDLKRGQITSWAKENGYIHKTQKEVNQKGEEYFKVYDNGGYKNIGITEEGINLINNNLEDIIK